LDKGERTMKHKEELEKMIAFILKEELPYEKSWIYATELKERMEKEECQ